MMNRVLVRLLAILAASIAIAVGVLRLQQQRTNLPSWASGGQVYDGYLTIDGHAYRALAIREWLAGRDPGAVSLLELLRTDAHATTVTIPLAAAAVSLMGLSIPASFAFVVVLVFLGTMHLAGVLARQMIREGEGRMEGEPPVYWCTWWYLGLHFASTRTVGLLILDWGVAMSAVGTTLYAMKWARTPSLTNVTAMAVFMTFGLLTKVSALPFCVVPLLFVCLHKEDVRVRLHMLCVAMLAVSCGLVAMGIVSYVAHGVDPLERDVGHMIENSRLRVGEFLVEMVLLFQLAPMVLAVAPPKARASHIVGLCALVYLISVWVFRLPSTPRLYLPALSLGVPLIVASAYSWVGRTWVLWTYGIINLGLTGWVLLGATSSPLK